MNPQRPHETKSYGADEAIPRRANASGRYVVLLSTIRLAAIVPMVLADSAPHAGQERRITAGSYDGEHLLIRVERARVAVCAPIGVQHQTLVNATMSP